MKLYIIPSWYPSKLNPIDGAFFADWAGVLSNTGYDIVIIANILHSFRKLFKHNELPSRTDRPVVEAGLRTYRREAINPYPKLIRRSFQYYKQSLIDQFELAVHQEGPPDVVLFNSSIWAGAAMAEHLVSRSIPFLVSEHMKAFLLEAGFSDFQKRCVQTTYRCARKIVAVSSALEKQILRIFPDAQGKTTTIHNPVTIQNIRRVVPVQKTEADFIFIAVCLLRAEKRIDILINAFARLVKLGVPAKLKLAGDGPLRRSLERLTRRLNLEDRIEFLGYLTREQVVRELIDSDCLVLPSEVETFGLVLVEAMAAGLPVIATRCGGPQDIVTEETGLLVPVNDEAALCRAMQDIMDNYRYYEPEKIRRYVADKFSDKAYVAAFEAIFSELVSCSRDSEVPE